MVYFVLGKTGSGKTSWIRKLCADYIRGGQYEVTLLIPEQFSFETEMSLLEMLGPRDFSLLEVTNFSRLASKLPARAKPVISDASKALMMNIALETLKDELRFYKKHSKNPMLLGKLVSADAELKQNSIKPHDLEVVSWDIEEPALKEKTAEFSKVLTLYNAIVENRFTDNSSLLGLLCEYLRDNPVFKNKIVALDAFRGFTELEYLLLEEIIKQAAAVYFTFCAEFPYDTDDGVGVFSHTVYAIKRIKEIADKNAVITAKPLRLSGHNAYNNFPFKFTFYRSKELAALEKMIYRKKVRKYNESAPNLTVYKALNKYDECDFVAMQAKKLIREQGYRCKDIVIIERQSGKYTKELTSSLKKYKLPVFLDKRHNIACEPLIVFISAALELASSSFSTENVLRYLKTGLSDLSIEEISCLENYVFVWQIDNSEWKNEWKHHPSGFGYEFTAEDYLKLETLNKLRKKIVGSISQLKDNLSDTDGVGACRAVFEFLLLMKIPEKQKATAENFMLLSEQDCAFDCSLVWDSMCAMLDELANVVGSDSLDPSRFFDLFTIIAAHTQIGDIPHVHDSITIGSADRIRINSPKAVFLVGMNQDEFPLRPLPASIFTSHERNKLMEYGLTISASNEEKAIEERHISYTMLSLARDKLFISYPDASPSGEKLSCSEIPRFIKDYFPNANFMDTNNISPLERIESLESGFEVMAGLFSEVSPLSDALKEYYSSNEEYSSKLRAIEKINSGEEVKISDREISVKLFGFDMTLSASKIEDYNSCPFSYFCKNGIQARPLQAAEIGSLEKGSIIHKIFETLLDKFTVEQLSALETGEKSSIIDECIKTYAQQKLGGYDSLSPRNQFLLDVFSKTALMILERLIFEFSNSKFKIENVELKIGDDKQIPAYELKLDDGSTISLIGSIDRIDVMRGDKGSFFRIIDYKSKQKELSLEEVYEGLNLQMLIYLMSVWQNGKALFGELLPAGMLYLPAVYGNASLDRHSTEDDIKKRKISQGKMQGLLLNNEDVIKGMEEKAEGTIIPASINQDNVVKGSVISIDAFKYLNKVVDEKIAETAKNLHEGRIPVYPYINPTGRRNWVKCDFCPYRAVCGYESGDDCLSISKTTTNKACEELEKKAFEEENADG